jgi:pimeloyl-ACP methyl ester carboxylesterase
MMTTAPASDQAIMGDAAWQAALAIGLTEALRPGAAGWVDETIALSTGWAAVDLAAIRTSLTWWHGDRDRNAPLSAVQRLIRSISDARLIVWPDAGHLTPYRHESEILDELMDRR